ncbi:hypothetical protein [Aquibacillus halophilus]|uniref:hypothetical protein n=1 Tax=Aquibacillus halophilus TaxID=930132 RepID=UPI00147965F9|nr:hypothetical protein [Aquibacillus halophilus]
MLKVKMIVQTNYNGQLLREGKEYLIPKETAERWHVSNIAKLLVEESDDTESI